MMQNVVSLNQLWVHVNEINKRHFPENPLRPIIGNGQENNPHVMFILINPTHINLSSNPNWNGPILPFIGHKQYWRVLHKSGLFDSKLMEEIENGRWSVDLAERIVAFLKKRGFYMTNIVKWTGHDATLPDPQKIELFLPILKKEIELVKPSYIVTFGHVPFENLTGTKIHLSELYTRVIQSGTLEMFDLPVNGTTYKVIPCFFPVGRGRPKESIDILRLVGRLQAR